MANIKITELNGITKKANNDVLAIVDVSANETKKIAVEDLLDKNIELIAVTDTEPSECSYGEKYYNTTDKLIYTAIATDTWSEDGEEPISGILYIVYNEQASYSWNGTDLISVGGGKEDIVIDDEEPTDPDVKLWIDTGEIGSQASEITNEYSTSTGLGYSANYVNNMNTYSTDEVRIGTWIDGKPLYRKVMSVDTLKNNGETRIYYNSNYIIKRYDVYIENPIGGFKMKLPIASTNYVATYIEVANHYIVVQTSSDRTAFTDNYVIIEYTKTTD